MSKGKSIKAVPLSSLDQTKNEVLTFCDVKNAESFQPEWPENCDIISFLHVADCSSVVMSQNKCMSVHLHLGLQVH